MYEGLNLFGIIIKFISNNKGPIFNVASAASSLIIV